MDKEVDISSIDVSIPTVKAPREIKVSQRWPSLVELEPARPAKGDRPCASPVFGPVFGKGGVPRLGHESLLDMFE